MLPLRDFPNELVQRFSDSEKLLESNVDPALKEVRVSDRPLHPLISALCAHVLERPDQAESLVDLWLSRFSFYGLQLIRPKIAALGWQLFGNSKKYLGKVKLSNRSQANEDSENRTLKAALHAWLPEKRYVSWTELVTPLVPQNSDPELFTILTRPDESTFLKRYLTIACTCGEDETRLRSEIEDLRASYPIDPAMELKAKVYLARLDSRAYCRDANVIRALMGAILSTYYTPGSLADWKRVPMSASVPRGAEATKIKNLPVNASLDGSAQDAVVFSDVSSFTFNASGTLPAVAAAVPLHLNDAQHPRMRIISFLGRYIEVDLPAVLGAYVYLNVCAPCTSELLHPSTNVAPLGTRLGVTASTRITQMVAAALTCAQRVMLSKYPFHPKTSAPGDDCRTICEQLPVNLGGLASHLVSDVWESFGRVKEMYEVYGGPDVQTPDLDFCRAPIAAYTNEFGESKLHTLERVPLVGMLIQLPHGLSRSDGAKCVLDMLWNLRDNETFRENTTFEELADVIFTLTHDLVHRQPSRMLTRVRAYSSDPMSNFSGFSCTNQAFRLLEDAVNECSDMVTLVELGVPRAAIQGDVLRHQLMSGAVVHHQTSKRSQGILALKGEPIQTVKETWFIEPVAEGELVTRVRHAVLAARENMRILSNEC